MKTGTDLTRSDLGRHLWKLTLPGIAGSLAIMIFNLTDTFFVSRLGTEALAAMGFTFPAVMVIGSVAMGLSLGSSSVISRAIGSQDFSRARRTATDGIILAIAAVAVISTVGVLTIDPLFRLLGASGKTLELTGDYMFIWYLGAVAFIMPPVGDGALRATGDMLRPLVVMCVCALINLVLDPLLIFGLWGFPEMGVKGAALATVIARFCGMLANLYFLHFHARLLDWRWPGFRALIASWKRILEVGIPAALTLLLVPLSQGIFTRLAASVGETIAVAALAAGSRVENFALIFSRAYETALMPIIGQNWGARLFQRIEKVRRLTTRNALGLGIANFLIALPTARFAAGIFSTDAEVIQNTVLYLLIIFLGHTGLNWASWTSQSLNAVGKSLPAALFNAIRVFLLLLPGAIIGQLLAGFTGMLWGITAGNLAAGVFALWFGKRLLQNMGESDSSASVIGCCRGDFQRGTRIAGLETLNQASDQCL